MSRNYIYTPSSTLLFVVDQSVRQGETGWLNCTVHLVLHCCTMCAYLPAFPQGMGEPLHNPAVWQSLDILCHPQGLALSRNKVWTAPLADLYVCMLCCAAVTQLLLCMFLRVHHQPTLPAAHTHTAWRPHLCAAACSGCLFVLPLLKQPHPQLMLPFVAAALESSHPHPHPHPPSCRSLCPLWALCHSCVSCGPVGKPSWQSASMQLQTKSGTGLCQQTGVCACVCWDSDGCWGRRQGVEVWDQNVLGVDARKFGVCSDTALSVWKWRHTRCGP